MMRAIDPPDSGVELGTLEILSITRRERIERVLVQQPDRIRHGSVVRLKPGQVEHRAERRARSGRCPRRKDASRLLRLTDLTPQSEDWDDLVPTGIPGILPQHLFGTLVLAPGCFQIELPGRRSLPFSA